MGPNLPRTLPLKCTAGTELTDDDWSNKTQNWGCVDANERQDFNKKRMGFNLGCSKRMQLEKEILTSFGEIP